MALTSLNPNLLGTDSAGASKLSSAGGLVQLHSTGVFTIANTSANSFHVANTGAVTLAGAVSGITTLAAGNTTITGTITANGGVGTAGQVLTSGAAGNVYWSTAASPGPTFSVYRNTTFNPSGSTWSKIQLNVEDWDTNNNFDSTTNYRFTPTVAGYYQINAHLIATGSPGECYIAIYKNGSNYAYNHMIASGVGQWGGMVSHIVNANGTTDYFELYTYTTASSPAISNMWMSGFLARSA